MKRQDLALVLIVSVGCTSVPATRELPVDHPAHPEGTTAVFDPGLNPFAVTPTYSPPMTKASGRSMPGMEHGEGILGMDLGGDKTKPDGSEPDPAGKYGCPMHPDVVRDAPGTCSECGMALRPMQKHSREKEDSDR